MRAIADKVEGALQVVLRVARLDTREGALLFRRLPVECDETNVVKEVAQGGIVIVVLLPQ